MTISAFFGASTRCFSTWVASAGAPLLESGVIVLENKQAGDAGWIVRNAASRHEIEGYPAETSVRPGGRLPLHVRSDTRDYRLETV